MESGDYQGVSGGESEGSEDGSIYEQGSEESGQESWAFF